MDHDVLALLNQVASEVRLDYNKLIGEASREFGHDIDWWVTPLATRNVFSSRIFEQCCYIRLVNQLLNNPDYNIHSITVNSWALAKVLRQLVNQNGAVITVEAKNTFRQKFNDLLLPIRNIAASLYHSLFQLYCARRTASRIHTPTEEIVLIDTFLYGNSFKNGACFDRHYPNLEETLSQNEKRKIFYLPTFYKVKNYLPLFNALRSSERQFLVKEDYLKAADYLFAFSHGFRTLKFLKHCFQFEGLNVTPLIRNELYRNFAFSSSTDALLKFRLVSRMREKKVKITRLINWFENQEIDHGLNAGFRRYYPETDTVGYQGYVIPNLYMCAYPTEEEYQSKVIPKYLAVPGRGWISLVKEFCPNLEVTIAPAFRFQGVWKQLDRPFGDGEATILVALPIYMDEARSILNLISGLNSAEGVHFKVKAHPATSVAKIVKGLPNQLPDSISFVTESFDELIYSSKLLISGASSVCLETIARGIPVIVIGNSVGVTQNSIPDAVPRDIWKLCYSSEELTDAISLFLDSDAEDFNNIGARIRERYFTPVSRKGVCGFLGFRSSGLKQD